MIVSALRGNPHRSSGSHRLLDVKVDRIGSVGQVARKHGSLPDGSSDRWQWRWVMWIFLSLVAGESLVLGAGGVGRSAPIGDEASRLPEFLCHVFRILSFRWMWTSLQRW